MPFILGKEVEPTPTPTNTDMLSAIVIQNGGVRSVCLRFLGQAEKRRRINPKNSKADAKGVA